MWSPRLCVREDMMMSVNFMMVVHREFHIDVGVMFDSLRPIPASFGQRKRRTKGQKGDAFLSPGTRRKGKPHAQERSLRSIKDSGSSILPHDPDALLGVVLPNVDEKLFVTFKIYSRI